MLCNRCGVALPWTMGRPTCSACAPYSKEDLAKMVAEPKSEAAFVVQEYPPEAEAAFNLLDRAEEAVQAATPQPPPVVHEHRAYVVDYVVADLRARSDFGLKKYGTRLQTHNGRDALVDAYQEALDLCCYLKQLILEREYK